jgi:hypothetical protein
MSDPVVPGTGATGGRARGLSRFGDYVKTGIAIVRLDPAAAARAAADPAALVPAVVVLAIGGAAVEVGKLHPHLLVVGAVRLVLVSLLLVGLVYLLARVLWNGRGTYEALYAPVALAGVILWPAVIPFAGPLWGSLASLWWVVVTVDVIRKVMGLTTGRAVLVMAILVAVFAFVALAVVLFFGMAVLSLIGLGRFG